MRIVLPNNWRPRHYQLPAWSYLEAGGRHAELIWHRRSGKDEVALHRAAVAAMERVGNYWHMLPLATQARKAIWEAVNPHTGRRRIDEAFPLELRETTREQEMMIRFINGSTWQVVGSDNFNALVGSPPVGVVYSEWALANPAARAYLRPILAENNGWQLYITTPRGKNHAWQTFQAARREPDAFAQVLTVHDTGVLAPEEIERERAAYIADFGEDMGVALFEQEYLCSFDAAILGAIYGAEIRRAETEGRICRVPYDPALPVETAWDFGFADDTAIWFFQPHYGEVRFIEFYAANGQPVEHYAEVVNAKPYRYGRHWLPHDARPKTFASGGKSIYEQLWALGIMGTIVPNLSVADGIQAARQMWPRVWMDEEACADGLEALRQYQREWDDDRKMFRDRPRHDWTSHAADAFRMAAVAYRLPKEPEPDAPRRIEPANPTLDQLWDLSERRGRADW